MSDTQGGLVSVDPGVPDATASTAGALLRQARQSRGLHIAALAAAIKVSPRKLELLENDRFDELPGPTFTRALAQTVCRTLKLDPGPVMAMLPVVPGHGLEQMSRGLNAPFNDRPVRRMPGDVQVLGRPAVLAVVALLTAAAVIYALPAHWVADRMPKLRLGAVAASAVPIAALPSSASMQAPVDRTTPPDVAPVESVPALSSEAVALPADASASKALNPAPAGAVATVLAPPSAAASSPALQLRARGASWVEVADGRGRSLLARMVQPGETLSFDGASPLRLKIGKASAMEVVYKGQPVDLLPVTSRDMARLELK